MERAIRKIYNKFLQIIRQAFYSVVSDDTSEYPNAQVTSNSKATKVMRLSTYGLVSNPPLNAHVLLFQSQGQESTKFGIFNDFLRRKKGLAEGECALYNTLTGAMVFLKADGSILIESPEDKIDIDANTEVNLTAPTINADATIEANVTAPTINAEATVEINITAPQVNVNASTQAIVNSPDIRLGDGGSPALEKLMNETAMALINGHTHFYYAGSIPTNTGVPNQQMTADTHTTKDTKGS